MKSRRWAGLCALLGGGAWLMARHEARSFTASAGGSGAVDGAVEGAVQFGLHMVWDLIGLILMLTASLLVGMSLTSDRGGGAKLWLQALLVFAAPLLTWALLETARGSLTPETRWTYLGWLAIVGGALVLVRPRGWLARRPSSGAPVPVMPAESVRVPAQRGGVRRATSGGARKAVPARGARVAARAGARRKH